MVLIESESGDQLGGLMFFPYFFISCYQRMEGLSIQNILKCMKYMIYYVYYTLIIVYEEVN